MAATRRRSDPPLTAWNETRERPLVTSGRAARSWASRLRGLIGTTGLAAGEGLLIEPCSGIHSFGMRYSFDALFLDREGRVVHLMRRMSPNRVSRYVPSAQAVLELPAGAIDASGTGRHDRIRLDSIEPRASPHPRRERAQGWVRAALARAFRLLADHVVPASFFALVLIAQVMVVADIWRGQGPASGLDPAARAWLLVQRCLAIAFTGLVALLFAIRTRPVSRRARPGPALVALAGTFVLGLQLLAPVIEPAPHLTVPGAVLLVFGNVWTIVSLAYLGRRFGVFPEARGLVRSGPYRRVRHPIYLGEITSALGSLLPSLTPFTAGLFGLFVALQYWRAINEERALQLTFPEYADYARRTWRILPGLY